MHFFLQMPVIMDGELISSRWDYPFMVAGGLLLFGPNIRGSQKCYNYKYQLQFVFRSFQNYWHNQKESFNIQISHYSLFMLGSYQAIN